MPGGGTKTRSANPYFADYTFDYDALHLPIHNALELAWCGPEEAPEAAEMNGKIAKWGKSNPEMAPSKIRDGYTLDGKIIGKNRSDAFLASFMLTAAAPRMMKVRKGVLRCSGEKRARRQHLLPSHHPPLRTSGRQR